MTGRWLRRSEVYVYHQQSGLYSNLPIDYYIGYCRPALAIHFSMNDFMIKIQGRPGIYNEFSGHVLLHDIMKQPLIQQPGVSIVTESSVPQSPKKTSNQLPAHWRTRPQTRGLVYSALELVTTIRNIGRGMGNME